MLRLPLLLILLTHRTRTAYITDPPSFADRLDKLYEKLEKLTVAPIDPQQDDSPEKLLDKLDRLNSLTPDRELSEDDEELLSAMQTWGMLSADQLEGVVSELQRMKEAPEEAKSERMTEEYSDGEWDEDLQYLGEGDYPMDANEDWNDYPETSSTAKPVVTPSAITKLDSGLKEMEVLSAADPIAATNERPRILDDSSLSPAERAAVKRGALAHISSVVRGSKCLTPQPRWLLVRQLAPAADTVYMPPCVQLHRCAPDSGCCYNEAEVCAPVDGKYVTIPFMLNKADGNFTQARMVFFNHTRCACVSRETLQSTVRARVDFRRRPHNGLNTRDTFHDRRDSMHDDKDVHDRRNSVHDLEVHDSLVRRESVKERPDWRSTAEPKLENDEEPTAAPQLRRCTCPGLFQASISDEGCSCVCSWPDLNKRRDCMSLAKGREHFGMRDRVCVDSGDCNPPSCEYGAYEKSKGICPTRRYRRMRYQRRFIGRSV